ncbi:MAG: hypothetical protein M3467_00725 [Actinomycetota bacterium]|nr:hypothetical protein [Actinomycetota bacterium]
MKRPRDLGAPHPYPWLQDGGYHRADFAWLVVLNDDIAPRGKLKACAEYVDRWSEADLLQALQLANSQPGFALDPTMAELARRLARPAAP